MSQEVALASVSVGDVVRGPVWLSEPGSAQLPLGTPLAVREVQDLRRSISSGSLRGSEVIAVEQALPAAPFVLAGCLLTAVLGGSVVSGIHALLGWVAGGGGWSSR